jgi:DNA-directed RNA polymerase subunit RPC12/RpoP
MPHYIVAKCPNCPNKVIVEQVEPNPKAEVWIHSSREYEALCVKCGHQWTARGPQQIELVETKSDVPKPKGDA